MIEEASTCFWKQIFLRMLEDHVIPEEPNKREDAIFQLDCALPHLGTFFLVLLFIYLIFHVLEKKFKYFF